MLVKIGGVLIAKNISHLDSTHLFNKSDFLKKVCVYACGVYRVSDV